MGRRTVAVIGTVSAFVASIGLVGCSEQTPEECMQEVQSDQILSQEWGTDSYYQRMAECTPTEDWPTYSEQQAEFDSLILKFETVSDSCSARPNEPGDVIECITQTSGARIREAAGLDVPDPYTLTFEKNFGSMYGQVNSQQREMLMQKLPWLLPEPLRTEKEREQGMPASHYGVGVSHYIYLTESDLDEIDEAVEAAEREANARREAAAKKLADDEATCEQSPSSGCRFIGSSLPGRDFSGLDLTGAYFSEVDLTGANFDRAILTGVEIRKSDLSNATFVGATSTDEFKIYRSAMSGASFDNASFVDFRIELSRNDLTMSFEESSLEGAGIDLRNDMSFKNADLRNADLVAPNRKIYADVVDWATLNFEGADLTDALVQLGAVDEKYWKANWEGATCPNGQVITGDDRCPKWPNTRVLARTDVE